MLALVMLVLTICLHLHVLAANEEVNLVDPHFGYSVGHACHQVPTAVESRPVRCLDLLTSAAADSESSGLTTAVILIAHNEAGCAIRRTLLALAERTPVSLLTEVIVSDDSSHPAAEAATYEAGGFDDRSIRVRWLRSESRLGVARARQRAAEAATASVLVFLDSHCEVQAGWLPPILQLLAAEPRAVALPAIESIDRLRWTYRPAPMPSTPPRGGFDWNLSFHW